MSVSKFVIYSHVEEILPTFWGVLAAVGPMSVTDNGSIASGSFVWVSAALKMQQKSECFVVSEYYKIKRFSRVASSPHFNG